MHVESNLCVDLSCGEDAYGLDVTVLIDGVECGHATSGPFKEDEGDFLITAGFSIDIASASDVPGCGTAYVPIHYRVDGRAANETYEVQWYPTDLTYDSVSVGDAMYISGYIVYGDTYFYFPCSAPCEGPLLEAFVGNKKCGELQSVGTDSRSYFRTLIIAGDDLEDGCPEPGDIVTFTVDGAPAHEQVEFTPGFYNTNLTTGPRSARFAGHACIDANCGTGIFDRPVVAMIGDVVCGEDLTGYPVSDGIEQSLYELFVAPAEKVAGCGTEGALVEFYIDGRKAAQTATWTDGTSTGLTLWVGSDFAGFSGSTTCDGSPCYSCFSPCQTANIQAYIGDVSCGGQTPYGWLIGNGYGPLIVRSADDKPGCGIPGATVTFKINDRIALETAEWSPGFQSLPLSVGDQLWGDINCSRALDGADALRVIRYLTDQEGGGNCFWLLQNLTLRPFDIDALWADIDCSGAVNLLDAIKMLAAATEIAIEQATGCPPPGSTLQAHSPVP
jgi:hypothetical protein